ncbi:lipoyl synthase [Aliifodinibius sp. S!AR15-10]|uniref:lipoyl synthase n=1 Tax=Aliifodinibius sp. S!AR15-10 TaxID=2950437 RepID=UPI002856A666|nr:lipoyl synthase [Aliifodinibius sp. S!AR15-10]
MIKELNVIDREETTQRRPDWLRVKLPSGEKFKQVADTIQKNSLNTVCAEARCPNIGECWGNGTATFMILGDVCTRSCSFCAVKTGRPVQGLDWDEPRRVTDAAKKMDLKHVVITSVNRDEREDGGAPIFAECHRQLRDEIPGVTIESLIPDFRGVWDALQIVIDTPPDVLSHNLETVPRLYREVRPQAKYKRSLELLQRTKDAGLRTKTGIMVGLGEKPEEVNELMQDCVDYGVDVLTIGQYMQPTKMHHPVEEWVHPDQFKEYKRIGEEMGLEHVESGPLVRSSYHAERHV